MKISKVLLPPEYEDVQGPLIFLAGPWRGAPDWQTTAIELIHKLSPVINIASPRREYTPFSEENQIDWETRYLRQAANNGAILFWLAREMEHDCNRPYAKTTRFELAEWKMRHERDGAKLAIGIENGFSGEQYIRMRFLQDCPDLTIHSSLKDTCAQAVELATV